jgi:hypothetical protein
VLYEIVIRGYVSGAWFAGLSVVKQADTVTTLRGNLADQAALQGVIRRISDLGMELVSVNGVPGADEPQADEA